MEWGGEKESVYFKIKYLQIDELGFPILRRAENNVMQNQRYTKDLEDVLRVQTSSSWHI